MKTKEEYQNEKYALVEKAEDLLVEQPSAVEEMSKIMFRLNYIKGILFALGEKSEVEKW